MKSIPLSLVCGWLFVINTVCTGMEPLLRPNDRVALLGGTFVERLQGQGSLEAELQCRRPQWRLSVRNLGWSGDDVHGIARKRFGGPQEGFARLIEDIQIADPTAVVVMYGFAEASNGASAVDQFEPGLRRLVTEIQKLKRRVILVEPIPLPGYRVSGYEGLMSRCRATVGRIGRETQTPVVPVDWQPSQLEVVASGLLPNGLGYARFASLVSDRLAGKAPCDGPSERLRNLIAAKNQLFFHRYRPQNETYLYLFRKTEQGNNAVEVPRFDPLIVTADQEIWDAAK